MSEKGIVHSASVSSFYICVPKRSLSFIKPGYSYTSHLHMCDGNILRVKFIFTELTQKPDLPACINLSLFCIMAFRGIPGGSLLGLRARDFMATNPEHLEILKKMGVSLIHLKDGRVQLVQHAIQVRHCCTN